MLTSAATESTHSAPAFSRPASPPRAASAGAGARPLWHQFVQCLAVGVLAAGCYFLISHFLLQSVKVVGRSMAPTLHDSQHCLLNRWVYHFRAPRPSDIVVLLDPSDRGFSVKRVIATPGDSVYLKDGGVYLNGHRLNETYLVPGTLTFTDSKFKDELILCGKNQYFVLGDNRPNSIDSRTYGVVPRQNILGPIIH